MLYYTLMKNIEQITKEELDNIKVVTFDIDGVIAPTGTEIREGDGGTKLYMESEPLSGWLIENLKKLKNHVRLNFSSGRNILYLKSLVNEIFDDKTILQAENGNITWVNNQMNHPVYDDDYFLKIRNIKERIKELKKTDERIRGFEPKLLILTVHCEKMDEIPKLVKEIAGNSLYCLWTNEGYDIGSKEMSKGIAIKNLAEQLGVEPKQIITTGNNYNDEEMLHVGKGVTVEPERVEAEYFIEHSLDQLGGELLVKFLLDYYNKRRVE